MLWTPPAPRAGSKISSQHRVITVSLHSPNRRHQRRIVCVKADMLARVQQQYTRMTSPLPTAAIIAALQMDVQHKQEVGETGGVTVTRYVIE